MNIIKDFYPFRLVFLYIIFILFSVPIYAEKPDKVPELSLRRVKVEIANVRYNPNRESKIIGRLRKNLLVKVIDTKNSWVKISLKGYYFRKNRANRPWGFIYKTLIEPTDIQAKKVLGISLVKIKYNRVNIRKNSNTKSKIIGKTRKSVILGVLKKEKNWITVIIPEIKNNKIRTGYIYAPLTEEYIPIREKKTTTFERSSNTVKITGSIAYDLTLYRDKSYIFKDEVRKLKDVEITVESGVKVNFENCLFISEDNLTIKGTVKNPIIINTIIKKDKKKYAEIRGDKILFENCIIDGNLRIIADTKKTILKIKNSKITGNIEIVSFKNIALKGNSIINSLKGLSFIKSKNIIVTDSLFLRNGTAIRLKDCKDIKIKFNTFYKNSLTLISNMEVELSDNFWYNESKEKIYGSFKTDKTIIIEPRLLYPSEMSPAQMYEHTLFPEEINMDDVIELELFFNRDMDINSQPILKIYSKKHKQYKKMNIYEQEWISSRSWFARVKLPKEIKSGNYKIIYSNINAIDRSVPKTLKAPEISVLKPAFIHIRTFIKNKKKNIILDFSGSKIFNIVLYRQSEENGYSLYKKWKYNKNLKRLTLPVEFKKNEKWVEFEAFVVNESNEILAKSKFIRVNPKYRR